MSKKHALYAILALLPLAGALVDVRADAAESFNCGAGGKPNAKSGKCDCPGGKEEKTIGTTSKCVEKDKPIGTVIAPTAKPTSVGTGGGTANFKAPSSCPLGMKPVPGGKLTLGETKTDAVVSGFCMDVTETSVAQYSTCVLTGQCTPAIPKCVDPDFTPDQVEGCSGYCNVGHADRLNHPLNCVDWGQATMYCAAMGKRLPTEEEFEWAARGATKATNFPWGNQLPDDSRLCWSGTTPDSPRQTSCPVGAFPSGASPQGILDLGGGVNEWTSTKVGSATNRIYRGGSWYSNEASRVMATKRYSEPYDDKSNTLGFRCVK